ncbi:receptor-like protein 12 [Citrus clementina]|uniref:receptor-like protein 12 n=1 Tax=Citrus clementina TaxID=85681 RepID=UPI000CED2966|nr:receptor-like protein 12 [Citrus x clementina]
MQFSGQIPPSLGNLNQLQWLDLAFNNFLRELPASIGSLSSLERLDVFYCDFSGQIPPSLDNNLSGELLQCLGNFSGGLSVLSLQGKNFFGTTPDTFMNGSDLRMVDLSHNLLQGKIPKSLANCAVLCGKPLPKECENSEAPANKAHIEGSEDLFSGASDWKIVLTGYTGRIVVGLVFGFNFSTGIVRWFPKKLGMQLKTRKRIRRHRN